MRIRKQVYELTLSDLEQYPVWEFALDEGGEAGQDEATVRPFEHEPPLDPNEGLFIVLSDFVLADGTKEKGYLMAPAQTEYYEDLGSTQPTIIRPGGQVGFWNGVGQPDAQEIARKYSLLGKSPEQIFPVEFTSSVEIVSGTVRGELDGFYYLNRPNLQQLEVVR